MKHKKPLTPSEVGIIIPTTTLIRQEPLNSL